MYQFFADLAVVTHLHLDLTVDFERKILYGNVILDVEKTGETDFLVSLYKRYLYNFFDCLTVQLSINLLLINYLTPSVKIC